MANEQAVDRMVAKLRGLAEWQANASLEADLLFGEQFEPDVSRSIKAAYFHALAGAYGEKAVAIEAPIEGGDDE